MQETTLQNAIQQDIQDIPVTPREVDLTAPIVHSWVTLLRLHGKSVSPQHFMGGAKTKATPAECLRAARRLSIHGNIIRRDDLHTFTPMVLPCILLLEHDRSLVLLAVNNDTASVIQPEYGEDVRHIPLETLQADYLGYAVFATFAEEYDGRVNKIRLLKVKRWFWDVLLHYAPIYKHVAIASIIINVIGVAGSLFAMNVYDRVVPNNATDTLWVLTVGISLAYSFDFILRNVRGYFVDAAGRNADVILSSTLIDKVLHMRFETKPESTGALVNNLREFEALRDFFSSSTLVTLVDFPFLVIFLILVGIIGGPLVAVPLLSIPLMLAVGLWAHTRIQRTAERNFQGNMQRNAFLVEMINGLETIRCCRAENRMQQRWEKLVGKAALTASESRRYSTIASTFTASLTQFVSVGVIVWGVYLISAGSLTMGGLIGCNILVGRAMAPLMQLSGMINRAQQSRMALRALDMLMESPSENDNPALVDFGKLRPIFTLDDVSFRYPAAKQHSLEHVSLHIAEGEKIGIIGRMGSGKSTLGKLLVGLYPPSEGIVRLDDVDIQQMHTADVRGRVGYLPQDIVLFYGTIQENIALDDPGVSDRLILRAAHIAGVTDFIHHISAGFGEQVGERGMNLSGGQRQSLALARALLHDPAILILDEPTSNMDVATESLVKIKLREILPPKTFILITHRLGMLDLVDRVIVMEKGRVVMNGPREEIIQQLKAQQQATAPSAHNSGQKAGRIAAVHIHNAPIHGQAEV